MKRSLLPSCGVFALVLAGCNPVSVSENADATNDAGEESISLNGKWHVAAIDGEPVDMSMPLTFSGGGQLFDWEPKCAQLSHRYWIDDDRIKAPRVRIFVTDTAREEAMNPLYPPPCAIGLPAGLERAMVAVEKATRIEKMADGRLRLSGHDQSSITLTAQ